MSKKGQPTVYKPFNSGEVLADLNRPRGDFAKWGLNYSLHDKQLECLSAVFKDKKQFVFANCSRKFGKTELAVYALFRQALLNPYSACYYVCPQKEHARKVVWQNKRVHNFLGPALTKYVEKITNQDMTVWFKNGSFITLEGSDSWEAANGWTPHMVVYDEYKAFDPRFHIEMEPNLAAQAAPLIIIGTMPRPGNRNYDQYFAELESAYQDKENSAVFTYTSFDNPLAQVKGSPLNKTLPKLIEKLEKQGKHEIVQLEFFSKIVKGGSNSIFPAFARDKHTMGPMELRQMLKEQEKDLKWTIAIDPATNSTFAALLIAINKKTKNVFVVDEVYEKKAIETSTGKMWPRLVQMASKHNPEYYHKTRAVSDEREAWFINEVLAQFRTTVSPTQKHIHGKDMGISLIRDLMIFNKILISLSCENHIKEIEKYAKDMKGNVPKRDDHTIDALRYGLGFNNYTVVEPKPEHEITHPLTKERFKLSELDHNLNPDGTFKASTEDDMAWWD